MNCRCCKKTKSASSYSMGTSYPNSSSMDNSQAARTMTESPCCKGSCGGQCIDLSSGEIPYLWFPSLQSVRQLDYVRKLECEFEGLQRAFLSLTTHFARMQFRLRQIVQAAPEEREGLLCELEKVAFTGMPDNKGDDELPHMQRDLRSMGDVRRKQSLVIERLRSQLTALAEASEMEDTIETDAIMAPSGKFPVPDRDTMLCERFGLHLGHTDSSMTDMLGSEGSMKDTDGANQSDLSSHGSQKLKSKSKRGSKSSNCTMDECQMKPKPCNC